MTERHPDREGVEDGDARRGGADTEDGDARRDRTDREGVGAHPDRADVEGEAPGPSRRTQWAVVGLLAACLLGFPVAILFWPPTFLSYRDAFLALALVPGFLLGAGAVWLTVRLGRP